MFSKLEKPNAVIDCSSPIFLNDGNDFSCKCRNEGGKYPASVTWYEDKKENGETCYEGKILILIDVKSKQNNKTYKCVVQRYDLKDEKPLKSLFIVSICMLKLPKH